MFGALPHSTNRNADKQPCQTEKSRMIEIQQLHPASGPVLSVLMPVYNSAPFLREAIESILRQTFVDFEFIIIDDGSSDGSTEIIRFYSGKDARIHSIRQERHQGIVSALNIGLGVCRAEYIARMDGDDISLPDRFVLQLNRMSKTPNLGALGAALAYIDETGKELGVIRRCNLQSSRLAANPLLHPTVMMRREVLVEHQLHYWEKYRYAEDYYLWLEMLRFAAIDALDDVVLQYRISSRASRRRHLKEMVRATLRVKRDAILKLGIKPTPADLARMASESFLLMLPTRLDWWLYRRVTDIKE
jgi:glycosyltransferase involved in cell wall biosynthesis